MVDSARPHLARPPGARGSTVAADPTGARPSEARLAGDLPPRGGLSEVASREKRWNGVVAGRYLLQRLLGTGGQGAVWEAVHLSLGRRLALKVLPRTAATHRSVARLRREAQGLFDLRTPGLPTLYDHGWDPSNEVYYIAFEFIDGLPLSDVVDARGGLRYSEACVVARDVGEALAAMHESGSVHRDVTPSNVLVRMGDSGLVDRAWLVDLGVVFSADGAAVTSEGRAPGAFAYQPPDVGRERDAKGRPLPVIDQYMLAATLADALRGRFVGPDDMGQATWSKLDTPHRLAALDLGVHEVPRHARQALLRALYRPASMRFDDVSTFVAAFEGTVRPTVGSWKRRAREMPKNAAIVGATLATAAFPVLLAAWVDGYLFVGAEDARQAGAAASDEQASAAREPPQVVEARRKMLARARRCVPFVDETHWTLRSGAPADCLTFLSDVAKWTPPP
jgi:hypothetical protein